MAPRTSQLNSAPNILLTPDWQGRIKGSRIGLDARMLSHEKASIITAKLSAKSSKFAFPPQNLVDLVWKDFDQPPKSKEEVYIQPIEFTG